MLIRGKNQSAFVKLTHTPNLPKYLMLNWVSAKSDTGNEVENALACMWMCDKSVPANKLKNKQQSSSVCDISLREKKRVNKMDKGCGEQLIRKVFLDFSSAEDEINHVWKFPYARLAL